jgi:hypothetical protein
MKLRSTLLALALLLLMGRPIASAATTAQVSTPTNPAGKDVAPITLAQASPDCRISTPLSFNPSPIMTTGATCGACSEAACRGMFSGDNCGYASGYLYYCGTSYKCSATGGGTGWDCDCTPYP